MFNNQESLVSIGISDASKRVAVYVTGTTEDVLSILSKEFAGNMHVISGDQLTMLEQQSQVR